MSATSTGLLRDLGELVGPGHALAGDARPDYLRDYSTTRGLLGRADALVLPGTPEEVAAVVAYCYAHDVAIVPRGGGTGVAGGAVPLDGGVVLGTERLTRVREFEPETWFIHVEAGVSTLRLQRLARENGLYFAPDPGAAEQSLIGGNIATNAGGPHAFKYGVTGDWVSGVEAVLAPGEIAAVGGPLRKDVAGYDLTSLLVGSEGTLGIVTAAWLRLRPAPEVAFPVLAFFDGTASGCAAIEQIVGIGLDVSVLDYMDAFSLDALRATVPTPVPDEAGFALIAEVDGTAVGATQLREELLETLQELGALHAHAPRSPRDVAEIWRWRDTVSTGVAALRGGKLSEDIAVPLDRLAEAVEATLTIGARHGLEACSWGHGGDGNLHSTFLLEPGDPEQLERAEAAALEVFETAIALGGTISGEHGTGWLKRGLLERQWPPAALRMHDDIKRALDPKGLLNPGKKR